MQPRNVVAPADSRRDREEFLRFPEQLYARCPHWVCPLRAERRAFFDPRRNPFFANAEVQLFLARRDGQVVGRVSAHIYHPHNRTHNEKTGFFGFFECENNFETARALWDAARAWLAARGMTHMRGPANFTTNHEIGFLVDAFDHPPVIMMTYTMPYYLDFAERYGMVKAMDVYAYHTDDSRKFDDRAGRLVDRIRRRVGVTIRPIDMRRFDEEVDRVKIIYNGAWAPNWGFVPMDEAEFRHLGNELKQIIDPRIVLFAEVDGRPVGFSLALPDINQALIHVHGRLFPFGLFKLLWLTKVRKVCTRIRVLVMGILPEYQKRGIDTVLNYETDVRGRAAGYREAEMSWVLENNDEMNAVAKNLGYQRYKTYRIYEMAL
ncbi:MAG TPA: N-acetyltransferase [bacterium]|nr:N-acetyltransferase [bacterium]